MVQLRLLTEFQRELVVSYCKLAVVSVDPPEVNAALRIWLGAGLPFLSDRGHTAIKQLDIADTSDYGPRDSCYPLCLFLDARPDHP